MLRNSTSFLYITLSSIREFHENRVSDRLYSIRGLNVFLHIFPTFLDRSGRNSVQKTQTALSNCKFRECLCSGSHALIMGVDELCSYFLHSSSDLYKIRYRRRP